MMVLNLTRIRCCCRIDREGSAVKNMTVCGLISGSASPMFSCIENSIRNSATASVLVDRCLSDKWVGRQLTPAMANGNDRDATLVVRKNRE